MSREIASVEEYCDTRVQMVNLARDFRTYKDEADNLPFYDSRKAELKSLCKMLEDSMSEKSTQIEEYLNSQIHR